MLFCYPYMCVKGKSNIHQLKYYTSFLPDDFTHLPLRPPPPSPFLSFAMQSDRCYARPTNSLMKQFIKKELLEFLKLSGGRTRNTRTNKLSVSESPSSFKP